ncbi:hypothetical protein KSP39_PZI000091 [Platanthera zijinensis]|uniref:Uncharacterized protein n=1 Tax=Platanthera zijinensis TaxID=2320716 RepID=A0AAP0C011_9ASPA
MDFMHPKPPESSRESLLWPSLRSGDLFAASELALGECIIGVSDSTRALSLLSNQPWGASSAFMSPTNTDQRHPVIGTSVVVESTPPNIASGYLNSLPGFDDHDLGSSASHEAGLRQIDDTGNANNQFSSSDVGPIEVYDHLHDLHWLL